MIGFVSLDYFISRTYSLASSAAKWSSNGFKGLRGSFLVGALILGFRDT